MSKFISSDEFLITKNQSNFTIDFQINSKSLINSLIKTKLLICSNISDDYQSISFKASSVKSLKKFMNKKENINYENTLKLIVSLSKQLQYLITTECECFYEYNIENIIVIDNDNFIYLSNDDLLKLSETNKVIFNKPFSRNGFISPELFKINSIPSELNYKTIYYSLGALIVYFLFDKNINNPNLNEILKSIEGTKLFGLLNRCLFEEADERSIIYL